MRSSILFFVTASALLLSVGTARAGRMEAKDEAKPSANPVAPPADAPSDAGSTQTANGPTRPVEPARSPDATLPASDKQLGPDDHQLALPPSPLPPRLDHKHQFGLELGLGLGYRMIKPYRDIWCGKRSNDPDNPNEPFCWSMSPLFLDMGLTFGASKTVELVVHTRVGLMKDSISERNPISLLGGVRLWMDATGSFKWALGIEAMLDFTKQDGDKQKRPGYGVPEHDSLDIGGRFYGQMQYDFLPYLGLYAQFGGLVGALRWLRVEMEGTLGIQGRLPRF